jgi:hypothetical protein
MSIVKKPLQTHDFPVNAEGKKIKKQDGTSIANTHDPKTLQIGLTTTTKPAARKISGLPEATPGPRSAVCHSALAPDAALFVCRQDNRHCT